MLGGLATLTLIITILLPNHQKQIWTYREHGIVREDDACRTRATDVLNYVKNRLPKARVSAEAECSVDPMLNS